MKSLIVFTLLIIFSLSLSKANHHDGGIGGDSGDGFTVDLIHRDSLLSPLHSSTHSRSDHLENAFLRSISRASHLSRKVGFASKFDANIYGIPGEYIMKLRIGTPPVEVLGVADTGSDLTWAQCKPCKNCYKQVNPPILVPSSSSTYRPLTCQTKACQALGDNQSSCDSKNMCHYKMTYGDQSSTLGDLAVDTLWFESFPLENAVFGCGRDNNGTFNENVSGIIGLGGGPLSIINQFPKTIQGKFSYCLVDNFNTSSKIHFGNRAGVSGQGVVSTPIITKDPSTYYYVSLESISVGKDNSSYNESFSKNEIVNGNIIIDSGTTLTFIPQDFHDHLTSALTTAIGGKTVPDPQGILGLCYKDLDVNRVPIIMFHFTGANVELPPANTFLEVQDGVSCLTILPSDGVAIFGNLLQQNLLIGFDLVNEKVSFRPSDCTRHAKG